MTFHLGVDVGTTYTSAATWRDGAVEIVGLGDRTAVTPTVVAVLADGTLLTGAAAQRRARIEPERVAREFKRRVGDPVPLIIGGSPWAADMLVALVVRSVVDHVTERAGVAPATVVLTCPASWGGYKRELVLEALRACDIDEVTLVSEPEASAVHFAAQSRVEPGSTIAVYDLGGGTFDAAVLRKELAGWELLGDPQGIERLGGIDFDEAVFHHVVAVIGDLDDATDDASTAAVAQLRQDCVEAKEALSSDSSVSIPVFLPGAHREVRLTRQEFEAMISPTLAATVSALRRALRAANVEPADLDTVLLMGGSSRTPLVADRVNESIGRPVALDAHPKLGTALGAAIMAATDAAAPDPPLSAAAPLPEVRLDRPDGEGPEPASEPRTLASVMAVEPATSDEQVAEARPDDQVTREAPSQDVRAAVAAAVSTRFEDELDPTLAGAAVQGATPPKPSRRPRRRRWRWMVSGLALIVVLAGALMLPDSSGSPPPEPELPELEPDASLDVGAGVSSFEFSPDGSLLAVDGPDGTQLWDVATHQKLATLNSVAFERFSHDGRFIKGDRDGMAVLWDVAARAEITIGPGAMYNLEFLPSGNLLVAELDGGTMVLWDTNTRESVASFQIQIGEYISGVPHGLVAIGDGIGRTLRLWDVATHTDVARIDNVDSIAGIGDTLIAVSDEIEQRVRLWDTATQSEIASFEGALDVDFSPSGDLLAIDYYYDSGDPLDLWDISTRSEIAPLDSGMILEFSPGGDLLLTHDSDGIIVRLWDVADQSEIATFEAEEAEFLPDGDFVVVWGFDARLWDVADQRYVAQLGSEPYFVEASPDGELIASSKGEYDEIVQLSKVPPEIDARHALL